MKVFYPVCSPTDPFATFFSCTVCSHTKPKNSFFTLIFGVCLTLFCSVEISWIWLRGQLGKKILAKFYHTQWQIWMSSEGSGMLCWALPGSHTVFNGSCMSSLHLLGAKVGNNWAYSGLVWGTCEGTSVQVLPNHLHGPAGLAAAAWKMNPWALWYTKYS